MTGQPAAEKQPKEKMTTGQTAWFRKFGSTYLVKILQTINNQ
jgi:hypothetical protein